MWPSGIAGVVADAGHNIFRYRPVILLELWLTQAIIYLMTQVSDVADADKNFC